MKISIKDLKETIEKTQPSYTITIMSGKKIITTSFKDRLDATNKIAETFNEPKRIAGEKAKERIKRLVKIAERYIDKHNLIEDNCVENLELKIVEFLSTSDLNWRDFISLKINCFNGVSTLIACFSEFVSYEGTGRVETVNLMHSKDDKEVIKKEKELHKHLCGRYFLSAKIDLSTVIVNRESGFSFFLKYVSNGKSIHSCMRSLDGTAIAAKLPINKLNNLRIVG